MEDGVAGRADEQLGTKEKFWVARTQDTRPWLLKFARGEGSSTRGEDWAEWVVHKIAQAVGVPSAVVVPATWNGRRGVLSRNFIDVEAGERLVHGNERLAESDPHYDSSVSGENRRYTLPAVRHALRDVGPPAGVPDTMTAFDAWSGFLMLDALVAGRDRHHENWGVIRTATSVVLAPSFDHGNALGFQESDRARARLLADSDHLRNWIERGRSRHFAGRPTLVSLARQARDMASRDARDFWNSHLAALTPAAVETIVSSIPLDVMSVPARKFALAIVRMNRRRLLDDHST